MPKVVIVTNMYIFVVGGEMVAQQDFLTDEDAMKYAKSLEEQTGKKCHVARWIEEEEE